MSEFFRKTEAGRRELRERRLGLPRPGRNLLLIIDGSRPVQHWVAMIQGASLTDAAALLDLGLIEPGTGTTSGDSQFAGMLPTATPGLNDLPTTPAGWTQLGGLTRPDGLPSPGAIPRHRALLEGQPTQPPTLPQDLLPGLRPAAALKKTPGRPESSYAPAGGREGHRPDLGGDQNPPAAPARQAHPAAAPPGATTWPPGSTAAASAARQPLRRLATAATSGTAAGPDSTLDGASGFVPLDAPAGGATGLGFQELYDSLNALVRETLGLLKGYRYSLKIERARTLVELEGVALEFVVEVRKLRGESRARLVERALGLGG